MFPAFSGAKFDKKRSLAGSCPSAICGFDVQNDLATCYPLVMTNIAMV
jgi:hypothetical protein